MNEKEKTMSIQSFGEVSWEQEIPGGNSNRSSKDLFLKLENGSNEIRIITKPQQYVVHTYKKEGDTTFGRKFNCTSTSGSCVMCEFAKTDKTAVAKARYYIGVINRKSSSYKILDFEGSLLQSWFP